MNAILLAAGYGKRLRPITNKIPKCLVQINKIPLLEIWLKKLQKAKIKNVLINTHYLSKKVEIFLSKKKYKLGIRLVKEDKLLGTLGTLKKNINFFDGKDGLLIHADNYWEESLNNLIKKHKKRPKNCQVTALIFETKEPESCGIMRLNKKKIMYKFYEKSKKKNIGYLANGATYVLSKEILNLIKRKKNFTTNNFSTAIMTKLNNRVYTYKTKKMFIDIGTIKKYKLANQYSKKKNINELNNNLAKF